MGLLRKISNIPLRLYRMVALPLQARQASRARIAFFREVAGPGELVFDVGANVGDWVESFLANGNRVVAIEPQASCVRTLRSRFGDRVSLVTKGVGSREETRELHIANESTISSFDTEFIQSVKATRFHDYSWNQTETVELTTLDRLIEAHGLPVFIKIDVEGFELEVLKGLSQPVRQLSFEYTVPENVQGLRDCIDAVARLDSGYRFNYLSGRGAAGYRLRLERDLDAAEFLRYVESADFLATLAGDVHARVNPSATSTR